MSSYIFHMQEKKYCSSVLQFNICCSAGVDQCVDVAKLGYNFCISVLYTVNVSINISAWFGQHDQF